MLRIHRNSTDGAAEGGHGRHKGGGKMMSAATKHCARVKQGTEEEQVRRY